MIKSTNRTLILKFIKYWYLYTKCVLVMPKYEENLWSYLSTKSCSDFNVIERLNLAIDLCLEVKKVHHTEMSHKDLKPSNIMRDASGRVILVDFGIGNTTTYLEGSTGTPGFLAPEQCTHSNQNDTVDIWALGKVLVLIMFVWQPAWKLLWSPEFLTPAEIETVGPLSKFIDLVKQMIKVNK